MKKKDSQPLVSVIVATKNEEKNIKNCLISLSFQTYPSQKIEVVLVDLNSSDKTRQIAEEFTKNIYNLPKLKKLAEIKNFRGSQINFGVSKSSGKILFFPDADMVFDKDLINEAVELFSQGYEGLYVPEVILGEGFFGQVRNFERSFYNQTCVDGLRFFSKESFQEVGGFDERNIVFGPDDWDLTKSFKKYFKKLAITKAKIYHNETRISLKKYLQKKMAYVQIFNSYIAKWGKNDPDVRKQFGFEYRFFGVFSEKGKWKKFLSRPDLAVGVYFLRFMVGLIFLSNLISVKIKDLNDEKI